jgi:hypothetical protein
MSCAEEDHVHGHSNRLGTSIHSVVAPSFECLRYLWSVTRSFFCKLCYVRTLRVLYTSCCYFCRAHRGSCSSVREKSWQHHCRRGGERATETKSYRPSTTGRAQSTCGSLQGQLYVGLYMFLGLNIDNPRHISSWVNFMVSRVTSDMWTALLPAGFLRWAKASEFSEPIYLLWRKEVTGCRRKWHNGRNRSVNMWRLSC